MLRGLDYLMGLVLVALFSSLVFFCWSNGGVPSIFWRNFFFSLD